MAGSVVGFSVCSHADYNASEIIGCVSKYAFLKVCIIIYAKIVRIVGVGLFYKVKIGASLYHCFNNNSNGSV